MLKTLKKSICNVNESVSMNAQLKEKFAHLFGLLKFKRSQGSHYLPGRVFLAIFFHSPYEI